MQAISLWDVDGGMPQIDKYTYSEDPNIVAGSCLGFGLCCCCVRSELDPAFALLSEHVHSPTAQVRVAAVMALGLAYAGTAKEDVRELLLPLISQEEPSVELVAHAALALGVVFAGTKDGAPRDTAAPGTHRWRGCVDLADSRAAPPFPPVIQSFCHLFFPAHLVAPIWSQGKGFMWKCRPSGRAVLARVMHGGTGMPWEGVVRVWRDIKATCPLSAVDCGACAAKPSVKVS